MHPGAAWHLEMAQKCPSTSQGPGGGKPRLLPAHGSFPTPGEVPREDVLQFPTDPHLQGSSPLPAWPHWAEERDRAGSEHTAPGLSPRRELWRARSLV